MIVDGKEIASEIYQEVKNTLTHLDSRPHLTIFTCAPNLATQKFLQLKKRKAGELGIGVNIIEFPETVTTDEMVQSINSACIQTDGIVVQLPLPSHIDTVAVLKSIPQALDVDAVHYDGSSQDILPPVVGAIKVIADRYRVMFAASRVLVVGEGLLVGKPAAIWAKRVGAQVEVINKETENVADKLQVAQIIISGAGQPHLITPEKISDQVLIFDAGTSEEGGELLGDADPNCAKKAALFTPVPGGIGPITVALIFRNLVRLTQLI